MKMYMNQWINSLLFAFGLEERKRRKEERARQNFLTERRENLGTAVAELAELTSYLVEACGPIGLDKSFVEDTKLAPFYAMGEVLSAQGEVYPEQEPILKITLCPRKLESISSTDENYHITKMY